MNRRRISIRKRKILAAIIVAAFLIVLFWLALRFAVERGLVDEQFGFSSDWGKDEEILISLGDNDYVSDDDVDTYLFIGTDAGSVDEGESYSGQLADFLNLLVVDNTMVDVQVLDDNGEVADYYKQQICLSRWYGKSEDDRNLNTVAAVSDLFG